MKIGLTIFGCILMVINLVGMIVGDSWKQRLSSFLQALGYGGFLYFIWFLS